MSAYHPETALELAQALREKCGVQGTGPSAFTSQTGIYLRLVNWINEAYREIQLKWTDWDFMWTEYTISVVNGTQEYAKPNTVGHWHVDKFYYDTYPLPYMKWNDYQRRRDDWDGITDEPEGFTVLPNDTVLVFPEPDANYSILTEGRIPVDVLTGDNNAPVIPADFRNIIVYKAMMYYALFENAPEVLQDATLHYNEMMKRLEADQLPENNHRNRSEGNDIVVRAY